MKKIQILYPDPQMEALRRVARELDHPISEIIREATAAGSEVREAPPVYSAGTILVKPEHLREAGHARE